MPPLSGTVQHSKLLEILLPLTPHSTATLHGCLPVLCPTRPFYSVPWVLFDFFPCPWPAASWAASQSPHADTQTASLLTPLPIPTGQLRTGPSTPVSFCSREPTPPPLTHQQHLCQVRALHCGPVASQSSGRQVSGEALPRCRFWSFLSFLFPCLSLSGANRETASSQHLVMVYEA